MINYFTFDGDESYGHYEILINGHKTFNAPARKYNRYAVPGRNGDIVEDLNSFENVEITYENCFFYEPQDFEIAFDYLKAELLSKKGYCRLEDTYHPGEFRLAVFSKAIEPTMNDRNDFAVFDLVFNAKPQRFLTSGETKKTFTSFPASITNSWPFDAKPLIRVYGNGTVGIGSYSFTVTNNSGNYIDIDCDIEDCYRDSANMNGNVTFTGHKFPILPRGTSNITAASGITKIEITPRWYKI